jgi:dissimilatory sulfite reductase (desulfoviridin) alpha/beta subunit
MATDYKALKNGGFMRQKQKNSFSLRLKVVGGNLSADQLSTIAEASRRFGRGTVHLTSRQGVEIPHVSLADVENIKGFLSKGQVQTGVCGPRVRTVTACQGEEICPSGCIDTFGLAKAVSERYFGRTLPHKFKFGITGCQNNCLKAEENDIGVKGGYILEWAGEECTGCGVCLKACREGALSMPEDKKILLDGALCNHCGRCVKSCPTEAWKGQPAYILSFGGTFGNRIAVGQSVSAIVPDRESFFAASDAALDFFQEKGQPGERFRNSIDREGWESFGRVIAQAICPKEGAHAGA